jgi:hypothetical protein
LLACAIAQRERERVVSTPADEPLSAERAKPPAKGGSGGWVILFALVQLVLVQLGHPVANRNAAPLAMRWCMVAGWGRLAQTGGLTGAVSFLFQKRFLLELELTCLTFGRPTDSRTPRLSARTPSCTTPKLRYMTAVGSARQTVSSSPLSTLFIYTRCASSHHFGGWGWELEFGLGLRFHPTSQSSRRGKRPAPSLVDDTSRLPRNLWEGIHDPIHEL